MVTLSMKNLRLVVVLITLAFGLAVQAERNSKTEPLVFIAHPDWHAGDLELGLVQPSNGTFEIQETILTDMQQFGAKYILLSGDMIDGLWLPNTGDPRTAEILKRKAMLREKFAPGADDNELVLKLCEIVYGGLNKRFRRFGLEPIAAIGDHEVGDQDWTQGSPRANAVPAFKKAFAQAYTVDPQGQSKYRGKIGSVPQRPQGTAYADTCYAFVDRNVLFVTVDLYRFEGVHKTLHPKSGILSVEMAPEVELWLDALLTETADRDDIQFTVVQAHHPLILPIRKIQTSGIMINDRERSAFWKLLRKHRVDVYFSGEVHALTPQIDPESQVAHIVCGSFLGNTAHNYMVCKATDGRLEMFIREKVGDGSRYVYETTGSMVIDKSTGKKAIQTSGRLTPLDLKKELFHYSFDQQSLVEGVANFGQFGNRLYRGQPHNVELVRGIAGKALVFGKHGPSFFETRGKAPLDYELARTITAWIKTTQEGRGTLCTMGRNDFSLVIDNGVPVVRAHGKTLRAVPGTSLNDDRWHHLVLIYPGGKATLQDCRFYINGKSVSAKLDTEDAPIKTHYSRPLRVGALLGQASDAYHGLLDDLRIWGSPLTAAEITALYENTFVN